MSKVVVLSTSLRPGSNSHMMAEQFAEGAKAAGHEVELISLCAKNDKIHEKHEQSKKSPCRMVALRSVMYPFDRASAG